MMNFDDDGGGGIAIMIVEMRSFPLKSQTEIPCAAIMK